MNVVIRSKEACESIRRILDDFSERMDSLISSCDQAAAKNPKEAERLLAKSQAYSKAKQELNGCVIREVGEE